MTQWGSFWQAWRWLWEKLWYSTGTMLTFIVLCAVIWLLPHSEPAQWLHPYRWWVALALLVVTAMKLAYWHHEVRPVWWAEISAPSRLRYLSLRERLILSFFVEVDRQTVWLPMDDSAVGDLMRKGLLERHLVIRSDRWVPHQVPNRVWDHLRMRWKGRITGEELRDNPVAFKTWIALTEAADDYRD